MNTFVEFEKILKKRDVKEKFNFINNSFKFKVQKLTQDLNEI